MTLSERTQISLAIVILVACIVANIIIGHMTGSYPLVAAFDIQKQMISDIAAFIQDMISTIL